MGSRHSYPPTRPSLTPAAFGLMTDELRIQQRQSRRLRVAPGLRTQDKVENLRAIADGEPADRHPQDAGSRAPRSVPAVPSHPARRPAKFEMDRIALTGTPPPTRARPSTRSHLCRRHGTRPRCARPCTGPSPRSRPAGLPGALEAYRSRRHRSAKSCPLHGRSASTPRRRFRGGEPYFVVPTRLNTPSASATNCSCGGSSWSTMAVPVSPSAQNSNP